MDVLIKKNKLSPLPGIDPPRRLAREVANTLTMLLRI